MPGRLRLLCLAALPLLAGAGCMSMMNMREGDDPVFGFVNRVPPKSIYGGVRIDATMIGDAFTEWPRDDAVDFILMPVLMPIGLPIVTFPFLVDLPLSAVADTLALPTTIRATLSRPPQKAPLPSNPPPTASACDDWDKSWAGAGYWAEYYRETHLAAHGHPPPGEQQPLP